MYIDEHQCVHGPRGRVRPESGLGDAARRREVRSCCPDRLRSAQSCGYVGNAGRCRAGRLGEKSAGRLRVERDTRAGFARARSADCSAEPKVTRIRTGKSGRSFPEKSIFWVLAEKSTSALTPAMRAVLGTLISVSAGRRRIREVTSGALVVKKL